MRTDLKNKPAEVLLLRPVTKTIELQKKYFKFPGSLTKLRTAAAQSAVREEECC
jgi:hypothetical protein